MHRRLDTVDRHAADLMFLVLSTQELLLGKRRPFSEQSQGLIRTVIANPPYEGQCSCCGEVPVLMCGRPRSARGCCVRVDERCECGHVSGLT